jgi:hypothetical protein
MRQLVLALAVTSIATATGASMVRMASKILDFSGVPNRINLYVGIEPPYENNPTLASDRPNLFRDITRFITKS